MIGQVTEIESARERDRDREEDRRKVSELSNIIQPRVRLLIQLNNDLLLCHLIIVVGPSPPPPPLFSFLLHPQPPHFALPHLLPPNPITPLPLLSL